MERWPSNEALVVANSCQLSAVTVRRRMDLEMTSSLHGRILRSLNTVNRTH